MGNAKTAEDAFNPEPGKSKTSVPKLPESLLQDIDGLKRIQDFHAKMLAENLADRYEAQHALTALEAAKALANRRKMLETGKLPPFSEPTASAADRVYADTIKRLCDGLTEVLNSYKDTENPTQKNIYQLWTKTNNRP